MESWSEHSRFVISLVALVGPLRAAPTFLGLTSHLDGRGRMTAATAAALTLLAVLTGGYFAGESLITALGASLASFQVAGGLIIALSGFAMLKDTGAGAAAEGGPASGSAIAVGVVPVGIPLLAGPGSLTAVMLESHAHFSITHDEIIVAAIVTCAVVVWLALVFAGVVSRVLGATGITIFQRVMGIMVVAIGVEIVSRGVGIYIDRFTTAG